MICGVFSHGKYRIIHSHCKKMHIGPFIVTLRECTYGRMHVHCIKIDKNRDREETAYGGRKGMQFMCENKGGGSLAGKQWLGNSGSWGGARVEIGPSIGPTR